MRVATLDLTPELFVEFRKACKGTGRGFSFTINRRASPDDAEVIEVAYPYGPSNLRLWIRSESFDEVPEGAELPELPLVVFETVYETDECLVAQ